ncbi:pentapeptide repeat-containing protein [Vibrio gazogenes]|uniref:Potassium channel domain-containing protein n=1 Tax=Vibrio gazogenes TaxID=687 RepID=A0A1Z2SBX1_VIBGA|nr:pentapeptide repeat-containing protein [Vibrio gazogenes]ASA54627.1 hypothetical protein BSQ33_02010 [Vibrio gazogenes]
MSFIFKQKAWVYALIYLLLIPVFACIYADVELTLGVHKDTPMTYLYFSVVSITTLGYGDILPNSSYAQFATASESILGIVLIGLFLNALSLQHSQEIENVNRMKKEKEEKDNAIARLSELTYYRGDDESFRLFGALRYVLSLGIDEVSIPEGKLTKLKVKSLSLQNSNLIAVDFSNSRLNDVKLTGCNLEATQFVDTNVSSCVFENVNLKRAKFIKSELKGFDFRYCYLVNATFKGCELQSAIFKGVDCKGVSFRGCDLRSANFKDAKNITEEMIKKADNYKYVILPNGDVL